MIGDVIGRPGRSTIKKLLPGLRDELNLDLVVLQGENMADGFGLTLKTVGEMRDSGVDVITAGNHVWDQKAFVEHLDDPNIPVARSLNYPSTAPGRGYIDTGSAVVISAIGRVSVGEADSPFWGMDRVLDELGEIGRPIFLDFHAEATSEKQAMDWHLDGRVSAVTGTHTHVATADTRILPNGTAYVTDIGMVGPIDSVIGMDKVAVLFRFINNMPHRLTVPDGPTRFNSVLIEVDDRTQRANSIERVDRELSA